MGELLGPYAFDGCWLPWAQRGSGLLRPPFLCPAALLPSWVLCGQSSRLLWGPWRQEEDRGEGPTCLSAQTRRGGGGPWDQACGGSGSAPPSPRTPTPACTPRGILQTVACPSRPFASPVTCTFPVPILGSSWSSAFGCLKGRVADSRLVQCPGPAAPRLVLAAVGSRALCPSPQARFFWQGVGTCCLTLEFLLPLWHLNLRLHSRR